MEQEKNSLITDTAESIIHPENSSASPKKLYKPAFDDVLNSVSMPSSSQEIYRHETGHSGSTVVHTASETTISSGPSSFLPPNIENQEPFSSFSIHGDVPASASPLLTDAGFRPKQKSSIPERRNAVSGMASHSINETKNQENSPSSDLLHDEHPPDFVSPIPPTVQVSGTSYSAETLNVPVSHSDKIPSREPDVFKSVSHDKSKATPKQPGVPNTVPPNSSKTERNQPDIPAENHFADMLSTGSAQTFAQAVQESEKPSSMLSGVKQTAYRGVLHSAGAGDDFTDRAGGQGKRAVISGAAMTYGAAKATAKSVKRIGKFGARTHQDRMDGLIKDRKTAALQAGKFSLQEGKGLIADAGSRLVKEGLVIAEDFEGSDDLGIQAIVKTKNTVRNVSYARRLFGNQPKRSVWQTLRQAPAFVSNTVSSVGRIASKITSAAVSGISSLSLISGVSLLLVLVMTMIPAAYALTGAASIAADDETITEVYSYITELDANLSKKIYDYRSDADVVDYYLNGSQTVDTIEISTDADQMLNYLDCVYGDYKFADVKDKINEIYSDLYQIDLTKYTQNVGTTSESDTVVDPDTQEPSSPDLISTYTPVYGNPVSKKPGSTLNTAILSNSICAGTFKLTFYCGCAICSEQYGNMTSTGVTALEGRTIAVDPTVIPYGTKVHIDGWGDFIAEDCGGAIKGNHIDVFVADHQRANSLGVQYASVYIMNGSIAGGIYLPAVGSGTVSHMKVKVTTQSVRSYLQDRMDDDQKDKSQLMNQIGQYTTRMNYASPLETDSWYVSRRYGYYYSGSVKQHFGADIAANAGAAVLAVCSGTVTKIGSNTENGTYLILQSGNNKFLYGNLARTLVSEGDTVEKGDVIAKVGSAGSGCVSSSLHMEYTKNGISLNPCFYLYNASTAGTGSSVGSTDIVEVARSQLGQQGGQPYWSYMGFSSRVAWCASFVSWCANQCGYIDAGIIPKHAACASGVSWFQQHGQWQNRNYVPSPGDIIYFDWTGSGISHHVGIVEKVEGNIVYTIEGNSSDAVHERHYTIGEADILGYGIPNY